MGRGVRSAKCPEGPGRTPGKKVSTRERWPTAGRSVSVNSAALTVTGHAGVDNGGGGCGGGEVRGRGCQVLSSQLYVFL